MREKYVIHQLEKKVRKTFKSLPIPTGSEICSKQLLNWVKKIETVVTEHQEIDKFLPEIEEKLCNLDREELIRRVVSLQFDKFLDDYRNGEELKSPTEDRENEFRKGGRKGSGKSYEGNFKRLFINLGKTDGFFPEQLIELINKNTSGKKIPIGKIDLLKTFSFFEVDNDHADEIINALNNARFNDRRVAVEIAQEKTDDNSSGGRSDRKKSKWADRRPDRKRSGKNESFSRDFKKDKKRGKKEFKKHSR
jgi:ATP-dependent RNA helicase DeaD